MNEWKIKHSNENSIALNRLAREEMKLRLLKDIRVDLAICEVEGFPKKEYINELKNLLNSIGEETQKERGNNKK